ncbi:MAG: membrane protein insertion efficiency factor YidD [Lentisphaeria bacterium]
MGARAVLGLIWLYRHLLSPLKPPCCRFDPTCSLYAAEAFRTHGFWRALGLALWRVARCHPFYRGPLVDPVPPAKPR